MIDEKRLIKELEGLEDHAKDMMEQCEFGSTEYFVYAAEMTAYSTATSLCMMYAKEVDEL